MLPLLILPLALVFGLATHGNASPAAPAQADSAAVATRDEPVTINFQNSGWDLATLYAVPENGIAVRLGEVSGGTSRRLVVPRGVVSGLTSVNFVAVPFGRNFVTPSGPVTVSPGDALDLSLSATENMVSVLPAR